LLALTIFPALAVVCIRPHRSRHGILVLCSRPDAKKARKKAERKRSRKRIKGKMRSFNEVVQTKLWTLSPRILANGNDPTAIKIKPTDDGFTAASLHVRSPVALTWLLCETTKSVSPAGVTVSQDGSPA
jgi:hypothetical protein